MSDGLMKVDYSERHRRLADELGDRALVLISQPMSNRNSDVYYPYRQESFFYYLTGLGEPQSALVVARDGEGRHRRVLFLRERDPSREIWDGEMLGVDRAAASLPIDEARPIQSFYESLPQLLKHSEGAFFPLGLSPEADRSFIGCLNALIRVKGKSRTSKIGVYDPVEIAGRMRAVKRPEEVARMRMAAAMTSQSYAKVLAAPLVGKSERYVHGMLVNGFLEAGAEMEAYPSIVAGGANACTLHYIRNDRLLNDGDLLLIDAGAQADYYACDVTRTFPVGKRFSAAQRTVYEIVLGAQKACIREAKGGADLDHIHRTAIRGLMEGMAAAGLVKGTADELIETERFRKYYPHGTCHWLGMDVHDVGEYKVNGRATALQAGMCFTIEPGLYFGVGDDTLPEEFRGIGVRVEDDVLITDHGHEILTAAIPKEINELENR